MAPFQVVCCPLAAIGITSLFAAWTRLKTRQMDFEHVKRERVAYLLWVAAQRM
jgi:hypothetical protein